MLSRSILPIALTVAFPIRDDASVISALPFEARMRSPIALGALRITELLSNISTLPWLDVSRSIELPVPLITRFWTLAPTRIDASSWTCNCTSSLDTPVTVTFTNP